MRTTTLAGRFFSHAYFIVAALPLLGCDVASEDVSESALADALSRRDDRTPPAQVTDLAASSASSSTIVLSWTAPGDDAMTGTATSYDIRWATDLPTLGGWTAATSVTAPSPTPGGTHQTFTVSGLSAGTTYYFGIASADEARNWAAVSPAATATTTSSGAGDTDAGTMTDSGPSSTPVGTAALPQPPTAYAIPAGATSVSSTAALISALASGTPQDIVVENGTYANTGYVQFSVGHRIWARSLGGATLTFALVAGGNSGSGGQEIHGLTFDISNASYTLDGAAISTWGPAGQNVKVMDTSLDGHHVLGAGIQAHNTNGFVVHRSVVRNFTDYGIFYMTYYPDYSTDSPTTPPDVEDCTISGIYRATRGESNGTAEAGIWAGVHSTVRRVKITDTGWMGVWTGGNCNDALFSDLTIDDVHGTPPGSSSVASIGIYVEHYTRRSVFRNLQIGPASGAPTSMAVGITTEWADPAYAGSNPVPGESISASHYNTFENGNINSSYRGVQMEDAEYSTVAGLRFLNQSRSAINDFRTSGGGQNTTWQNQGNDFSGIASTAVPYSTDH